MLFAAFLGYNPMQELLGPVLAHVPHAHAAYLTGRQFFPHLISAPFHDGLGVAFGFAIAACVARRAIFSALTGRPRRGRRSRVPGVENWPPRRGRGGRVEPSESALVHRRTWIPSKAGSTEP